MITFYMYFSVVGVAVIAIVGITLELIKYVKSKKDRDAV